MHEDLSSTAGRCGGSLLTRIEIDAEVVRIARRKKRVVGTAVDQGADGELGSSGVDDDR
jgi:hypothetical protein